MLISPKGRSQPYNQDHCAHSRKVSNRLLLRAYFSPSGLHAQALDVPGYEILRVIDSKNGSRAFLAQNNDDQKVYMIKSIRKDSLVTSVAVKRALAEQQCLKLITQLSLPFLPRLYKSFQDCDQLIMVTVSECIILVNFARN